jgi:serine/threonine-protein kinase
VPVLSGYVMHERIGYGGMGEVYRAEQKLAGRVVAVKVLHTTSALLRQRFRTEMEAIARLAHPNVVPIYEVGEEGRTLFFSMEYASGGNLAERVRDGKRLPADEAAKLIAAVAPAVDAVHRLGKIVHRDLKPGNILLAADGTP